MCHQLNFEGEIQKQEKEEEYMDKLQEALQNFTAMANNIKYLDQAKAWQQIMAETIVKLKEVLAQNTTNSNLENRIKFYEESYAINVKIIEMTEKLKAESDRARDEKLN